MDHTVPSLIKTITDLGSRISGQDGSQSFQESQRELLLAAQKLCIALQSPGQIVESFLFGSADNLLIKVGVDLAIFKSLGQTEKPVTLQQLTEHTGAEAALLERIMRGLASIHAVNLTGEGHYEASKVSRAFASDKGDAGARLFYDLVIPGMQPLPKFLAITGYKAPQDPKTLPFNMAFGPEPFFEWVPKQPEILASFQQWMTSQRDGHTHWLDFYPFENQVLRGAEEQSVLLVDIGGNMGEEILEVKRKHPSLPGRMILQDLPTTIDEVDRSSGLEAMAHDFFTPQPIQGARVYYLRNILHDWDDEKCVSILQNITLAMRQGYSKILLNEFCISDRYACAFAMRPDFMVMALAGARERTESQWRNLLARANLKIDSIWTAESDSPSIIEGSLI